MNTATSTIAPSLRRLYFVRFAFAIVWAALVITTVKAINPFSIILLVIYPLFDVAAAIIDARSSRTTKSAVGLYVNIVISLLAAIGLGVVVGGSGIPGVLRVWGTWAVVAGLVQLIVGVSRIKLGGQWPMIASGAISIFAGTNFFLEGGHKGASLNSIGGYAVLGGIFFLGSALLLGRAAKKASVTA